MDPIDEILNNDLEGVINDAAAGEPLPRLYAGTVRCSKIYLVFGIAICVFYFLFAVTAAVTDSFAAALYFIPVIIPGIILLRSYRNFRIIFNEDSFSYTDTSGHVMEYFFFDVMAFEKAENRFIIYLPDRDIEIPERCTHINDFLQNMPEWTKAQPDKS